LLQEKHLQGVILMGHSYSGMVITGVVDAVPERIAHLVYLDTFVPREIGPVLRSSESLGYIVKAENTDHAKVQMIST
jgi:pimeloyl-ACP methyl ester carboxylesterase